MYINIAGVWLLFCLATCVVWFVNAFEAIHALFSDPVAWREIVIHGVGILSFFGSWITVWF